MRLLSLDLGITTGYCVQTEEKVLDIGIIEWSGQEEFRSFLRHVIEENRPTHTLIEKPVILRGPLGDTLQCVVNAATGLALPSCAYVTPSQWKWSGAKVPVPVEGTLTVHERDAYRMGKWWLQNGRSSD